MPSNLPRFTLRADKEILEKMTEIAKKHERSLNQEIVYHMKNIIQNYESENGEINVKISNIGNIGQNNGTINMQ